VASSFILAVAVASAQDLMKVAIKAFSVAGNVSMLIGDGASNAVWIGGDGALLVDDEFPELIEESKPAVAAMTAGPIRFVLNTNWHYDHVDGNPLLARSGAVIIAHENSRKHMLSEQTFPESDQGLEIAPYPKEALPAITVPDSLVLHFNGDEIRMVHAPNAHSGGDVMFRFVTANVIHAGDLFFNNGFPFINISSGGRSRA
jgi:glyoxylase-like metal-dependent hydrolase (beta-lactamase superfamily II)